MPADTSHHTVRAEVAPGVWEIARPLRDTSRWHRWRQARACKQTVGHCWHADSESLVGWWCCVCSTETDGMPDQRCVFCVRTEATSRG